MYHWNTVVKMLSFLCLNRVVTPPKTLDDFAEHLILYENLVNEKTTILKRFEPLADQFHILNKYEVQIDPDVRFLILPFFVYSAI